MAAVFRQSEQLALGDPGELAASFSRLRSGALMEMEAGSGEGTHRAFITADMLKIGDHAVRRAGQCPSK